MLLSIAERAGAVELEPAGAEGLRVRLTGRGSPRKAAAAIQAARNRGWEAYRSIERYMTAGETCRRRQILDHFGDDEPGAADGPLLRRVRPRHGARAGAASADRSPSAAARAAPARPPPARAAAPSTAAARRSTSSASSACARGATSAPKASRHTRSQPTPCSKTCCARRRRRSPSCLQIRGIGPSFCEKHGASLLAVLRELDREAESAASDPAGADRPVDAAEPALAEQSPRAARAPLASEAAPT